MNRDQLAAMLTGWIAKLVMKLMVVAGGATAAASQDKATQTASALVTVGLFIVEEYQSYQAKQRAIQTAPDPSKPILPNPKA